MREQQKEQTVFDCFSTRNKQKQKNEKIQRLFDPSAFRQMEEYWRLVLLACSAWMLSGLRGLIEVFEGSSDNAGEVLPLAHGSPLASDLRQNSETHTKTDQVHQITG